MEKYPTILNILESGFGADLAQTLLDSIQQYGKGLVADGCVLPNTTATTSTT